MRSPRLIASVGMLLAAAIPAFAQQPRTPRTQPAPGATGPAQGAPGAGAMHAGMPMGMGGSPAAMLAQHKAALNLTDDQVKRLEALAAQQKGALEPNVGAELRARADLADARKGEGDLVATRKAMDKLAQLRIDGAMAHLKAMQDARAVLTAEQREKLPAMRGGMGMGGGMMGGPGGMRGHGMMGGPGGMRGHGMMGGHGKAPGGVGPMGGHGHMGGDHGEMQPQPPQ